MKMKRPPNAKPDSDAFVIGSFAVLAIGVIWSFISIFFQSYIESPLHKFLALFAVATLVSLITWRWRAIANQPKSPPDSKIE